MNKKENREKFSLWVSASTESPLVFWWEGDGMKLSHPCFLRSISIAAVTLQEILIIPACGIRFYHFLLSLSPVF